jgi:hypothetical protein
MVLLLGAAWNQSAARASAQREEFSKNFQRSFDLPSGQSVRLEHNLGSIVVRTHAKRELNVNANIRVSASTISEATEYGNQITFDIQQTAAGVSVRTVYPERNQGLFSGRRNTSFSVDYDILMPETAPLAIRNSFGNVSVTSLKASADITNSHGVLLP